MRRRNISSPAVLYPYSSMNSLLYRHRPASPVSPASQASAAHLPAIVPATRAGPMPPASSGFGIHAESPTSMNPPDTMQSFCLLTETWKLPVALLRSPGSSDRRGFLMALFLPTYSSMSDETPSPRPMRALRLSSSVFSTPRPMLTLLAPFGKTHPYPPGAMSWSRCIMQ